MPDSLRAFVQESNRIEGMIHTPTEQEMLAHERLLALPSVTVTDMERFVFEIGGGPLRSQPGMNVRVGHHLPPHGGPAIVRELLGILGMAAENAAPPWTLHIQYETLHPFMDGNGRSGRALWAWQTLQHGIWPNTLKLGFLHPAYYAALSEGRHGF